MIEPIEIALPPIIAVEKAYTTLTLREIIGEMSPVARGLQVAITELARLDSVKKHCARQADDDGCWFNAETAPEAYLQEQLRALHRVVEVE